MFSFSFLEEWKRNDRNHTSKSTQNDTISICWRYDFSYRKNIFYLLTCTGFPKMFAKLSFRILLTYASFSRLMMIPKSVSVTLSKCKLGKAFLSLVTSTFGGKSFSQEVMYNETYPAPFFTYLYLELLFFFGSFWLSVCTCKMKLLFTIFYFWVCKNKQLFICMYNLELASNLDNNIQVDALLEPLIVIFFQFISDTKNRLSWFSVRHKSDFLYTAGTYSRSPVVRHLHHLSADRSSISILTVRREVFDLSGWISVVKFSHYCFCII